MKVSLVRKLSPTEQFLYWFKERHQIYLKRQRGEPPPWTDDEVLQSYYFTNPYREHDKTTVVQGQAMLSWDQLFGREPGRVNPIEAQILDLVALPGPTEEKETDQ